jgi:hypothetical protein
MKLIQTGFTASGLKFFRNALISSSPGTSNMPSGKYSKLSNWDALTTLPLFRRSYYGYCT